MTTKALPTDIEVWDALAWAMAGLNDPEVLGEKAKAAVRPVLEAYAATVVDPDLARSLEEDAERDRRLVAEWDSTLPPTE